MKYSQNLQNPKLRNALKWYESELEVKTKEVSGLNLRRDK